MSAAGRSTAARVLYWPSVHTPPLFVGRDALRRSSGNTCQPTIEGQRLRCDGDCIHVALRSKLTAVMLCKAPRQPLRLSVRRGSASVPASHGSLPSQPSVGDDAARPGASLGIMAPHRRRDGRGMDRRGGAVPTYNMPTPGRSRCARAREGCIKSSPRMVAVRFFCFTSCPLLGLTRQDENSRGLARRCTCTRSFKVSQTDSIPIPPQG